MAKKLKDLFWKGGVSSGDQQDQKSPLSAMVEPVALTVGTTSADLGVDKKFSAEINQVAVQAMKSPLTEFYSQLTVLGKQFSNLDQTTICKLAFTAAQTSLGAQQGLTSEMLLSGLKAVNSALKKEQDQFAGDNEATFKEKIGDLENQKTAITAKLTSNNQRLADLEKEKQDLLAESNRLAAEQSKVEQGMFGLVKTKEERAGAFVKALASVTQRFDDLSALIKQSIGK